MGFSLWNLFEATILCLNAVCILNEDRFLSKSNTEVKVAAGADMDLGLLIEAIQTYPYLYDLSNRLYKDAKKKALAWQNISDMLNCTVEDCMKAWRNLRDRFVKEKNKLPSGAGAPESNWPFFEVMLFYGKYTKPRKSHTSTLKPQLGSKSSTITSDMRKQSQVTSGNSKQSPGTSGSSKMSPGTSGSSKTSPGTSRPSSAASTWNTIMYDTILSSEPEVEGIASEDDMAMPGGTKPPETTPSTASVSTKKRKTVREKADEEMNKIMGVTNEIVSRLQTRVQKTPNSTLADYICQELDKLTEAEAKKKRKMLLKVLIEDSD